MLRGTWKRQAGRKNPGDGIDLEKKEEVRMALSNSQYDAIMRVYNQRQFQDKRDQDQRVAEVFEKIPQVEALSDELAATMAQAARKLLAGDRAAADQLKKDAEFLKEQKALYLKQNGYPADYLELQYVCPDCKVRAMQMERNATVSGIWKLRSFTISPISAKSWSARILIPCPWNTMTGPMWMRRRE